MPIRRTFQDASDFLADADSLRFNASHPLSQGCVGCWAPYGNTFIDLLTGEVATPIEPLNQAPRVVERHGSAIDFWDGGNAPNGVTCKVNQQLVFSGSYTAVMIHKFAIGSANTKQQLAHWHAGGAGQKTQQFSTNNAENHVLNFGGNGTGRGANFREEATNSVPRGVWQWLVGSAPAIDTGGENRRVWVDGIEWENRQNAISQGINAVPSDTIIGGEPGHVFKGAGPTLLFALFDGVVWGREQALDFYNERFPFFKRTSTRYFLLPAGVPGDITRTASFNGVGTLNAAYELTVERTASFSGVGTLNATYDLIGGTIERQASFSGVGTLNATYQIIGLVERQASFAGVGTLNASYILDITRQASMSGVGTLNASYVLGGIIPRQATFSGFGTLNARYRTGGWDEQPPASGNWIEQAQSSDSWVEQ